MSLSSRAHFENGRYPSPEAADKDVLTTPVERECLPIFEGERHEGAALRSSIVQILAEMGQLCVRINSRVSA